jgi:hypothetical protein
LSSPAGQGPRGRTAEGKFGLCARWGRTPETQPHTRTHTCARRGDVADVVHGEPWVLHVLELHALDLLLRQPVLVKLDKALEEAGVGHHALGARPRHILQVLQDDHALAHLVALCVSGGQTCAWQQQLGGGACIRQSWHGDGARTTGARAAHPLHEHVRLRKAADLRDVVPLQVIERRRRVLQRRYGLAQRLLSLLLVVRDVHTLHLQRLLLLLRRLLLGLRVRRVGGDDLCARGHIGCTVQWRAGAAVVARAAAPFAPLRHIAGPHALNARTSSSWLHSRVAAPTTTLA